MPAETRGPRPAGIVVLATIAVVGALYLGRAFFVPIALSILFTSLVRPVVRRLESVGLSAPVGATAVLVLFLGVVAAITLTLADPVRNWVAEAPRTVASAQQRLQKLRRPLQTLTVAAQKVESAAGGQTPEGQGGARPPTPVQAGGSTGTSVVARMFGTTTSFVGGMVEVVLLTFLLLASGDAFLTKLVKVLPVRREKREAVEVADEAERVVARYMVANALINAGQGVLVGLAMLLLHVPNPVLWGILTFVLEFVPYLGAATMLILLTLAGLATFEELGQALLAPGVYLAITTLQNNLVSPVAYGRQLRLNPVAVFVGVMFWWFLWGVPGAFLAVPIIATIKILGDHVEGLAPVAEFLGD